MASNQETGHAVNISNFKILIDKCAAFGGDYNPSNADLMVVSMTTLWTNAKGSHGTLSAAIQTAKNPINDREIMFKGLNTLVTKTLNYFNSTKASKQVKLDAKGIADKIRGFGVKVEKLPDGTPDPNHVSTSQQSYVKRTEAFEMLITLYASDSNYAPNEINLQTVTLSAMKDSMHTMNDSIGTIIAPIDTARLARDHALYDVETGVVDVAAAVKGYVKGVYGATSAEAKLVNGIRFTRKPK